MRISLMGLIFLEVIKVIESLLEDKLYLMSGDDFKDYGGVFILV